MSEPVTEEVAVEDILDDLLFADEARLRQEIMYQRQHNANLERFKRMFFSLKAELDSVKAVSSGYATGEAGQSSSSASHINQLEKNLEDANEMAMLSMVTIGEYGSVLNFCKSAATAESYEALVDLVYECMSAYSLKAGIQINGVDGSAIYCQDESFKDEDTELINNLKADGRIIEHENVVLFNHKYINLCVHDFPFNDEEKSGRLKDYLAIVASSADVCIKTIDTDIKLGRQYQNLHTILKAVPQMIVKIQGGINKQNDKVLNIHKEFAIEVANMIKKQNPGDKYSDILNSLSSTHKEELKKIFSQSSMLTDGLVRMIKQLEHTYVDSESDVDIRDEIELTCTGNDEANNQNKSPLDF